VTASLRRTVTVTVAALGVAFVLVWAATNRPEWVIGDRHATVTSAPAEESPTQPKADSEPEKGNPDSTDAEDVGSLAGWTQDVAAFLVVAAGLLVLGRVLHRLLLRIHRDLEELVLPLDPLPDLEKARAAIERDEGRQREALAGSDVRNGIVECWVIFEEAAAEAEVGRRPAETATEFVVRFLHLLDVDPRPVGELEHLFHEARFSTHPMPADARSRAEAALAGIHRDLAQTATRTGTPT